MMLSTDGKRMNGWDALESLVGTSTQLHKSLTSNLAEFTLNNGVFIINEFTQLSTRSAGIAQHSNVVRAFGNQALSGTESILSVYPFPHPLTAGHTPHRRIRHATGADAV